MNRSSSKIQAQRQLKPRRFSPRSYFAYHVQAAKDSLARLYHAPMSSLLTIGVIAVALALPTGLLVFLNNINVLGGDWARGNQISLYLKMNVEPMAVERLVENLQARSDVITVNTISPQQGLQEFERESGFGSVLQQLPSNPLPTVVEVFPVPDLSVPEGVQRLYSEMQQLPQVAMAKLDMQWLRRLQTIVHLGQRAVIALGLFFALAVLLLIGNTMRLATQQQRREIEVIKLVGATNAFIRRPFLYSGIYYGLLGGLLACMIVSITVQWLQSPVEQLFAQYHSAYRLLGLSLRHSLTLLFIGASLGLIGSWCAVNRHIAAIDP